MSRELPTSIKRSTGSRYTMAKATPKPPGADKIAETREYDAPGTKRLRVNDRCYRIGGIVKPVDKLEGEGNR